MVIPQISHHLDQGIVFLAAFTTPGVNFTHANDVTVSFAQMLLHKSEPVLKLQDWCIIRDLVKLIAELLG